MPDPHLVALSGFGSSPLSIYLHEDLFNDSNQVTIPPSKKLIALITAKEVLALTSSGGSNMDFCNLMPTPPPLLALTIISSMLMTSEDLFIECLTAIKAFDSTHEDNPTFHKAPLSRKRVIQFLWVAANSSISLVVLIPHDSGHTKKFKDDIQENFIISSSLLSPNPTTVSGPSDSTLSSLLGSIKNLTNHLELDYESRKSDKTNKKNTFSKLPESSQSTILLASSKYGTQERTTMNPELEKCLQQSSLSNARTHINQSLASFGYQLDVSSILVTATKAGNLIWTRSSQLPKKSLIF